MIIKESSGPYGYCWIEKQGLNFYVYLMNGSEKHGPYMSIAEAMKEFSIYCS